MDDACGSGGPEDTFTQHPLVTATTAVRFGVNVLLLLGRTYSPPYVITAIGNQRSLARALSDSPDIQTYLRYVDSVGLGWSVTKESRILIQAGVAFDLQYARVPTGVEAILGPAPVVPTPARTPTATPTVHR